MYAPFLLSSVLGNLESEEEVPPKLNELYNDICTIIVEYTVFLEMFTMFLSNVKEVKRFLFFECSREGTTRIYWCDYDGCF